MFSVCGYYTVRKYKDGEKTFEHRFKNVITDAGLEAIASGFANNSHITSMSVSADTRPVTETSSEIGVVIGDAGFSSHQRNGKVNKDNNKIMLWSRKAATFQANAVVGNVTKVGIKMNNGKFFSVALITDADGQPTTVTVLRNETLEIEYELQAHLEPMSIKATGVQITEGLTRNIDAGFNVYSVGDNVNLFQGIRAKDHEVTHGSSGSVNYGSGLIWETGQDLELWKSGIPTEGLALYTLNSNQSRNYLSSGSTKVSTDNKKIVDVVLRLEAIEFVDNGYTAGAVFTNIGCFWFQFDNKVIKNARKTSINVTSIGVQIRRV